MTRGAWLVESANHAATRISPMNLLDRSLRDLARGLRASEFGATNLLHEATENLEGTERRLGAYKTRAPDFGEAAANEADKAFSAGRNLGLLQGIPCAVKDIYGIPGVPIFAGSSRELS